MTCILSTLWHILPKPAPPNDLIDVSRRSDMYSWTVRLTLSCIGNRAGAIVLGLVFRTRPTEYSNVDQCPGRNAYMPHWSKFKLGRIAMPSHLIRLSARTQSSITHLLFCLILSFTPNLHQPPLFNHEPDHRRSSPSHPERPRSSVLQRIRLPGQQRRCAPCCDSRYARRPCAARSGAGQLDACSPRR